MKIALIGQKGLPAHSGGIERHADYLATRLAKEGHEVFVYCRKSYAINKNIPELYRGVRLILIPTFASKHFETPLQTLFASIHVLFQDVDMIHYHGIGPALFLWIPRLFKPRARVIATFHCQDYFQKKWNAFARFIIRNSEPLENMKFRPFGRWKITKTKNAKPRSKSWMLNTTSRFQILSLLKNNWSVILKCFF